MANLLDALAVDRARLSRISVVVTGSNGKGSTAAFCAGIARGCGLRTGLFTSPHLYRWNERVRVDGADIGDDDLARLKPRIEEATSEISRRTGIDNNSAARGDVANAPVAQDPHDLPEADTAAVLEVRLNIEVARIRQRLTSHVGQNKFRMRIPMQNVVLAALLVIQDHRHRDPGIIRPAWVRWLTRVANQVTRISAHCGAPGSPSFAIQSM